jgi:hypothetical protein
VWVALRCFSLVGLSTFAPPSGGAAPRALPLSRFGSSCGWWLPPRSQAVARSVLLRTPGAKAVVRRWLRPFADCFRVPAAWRAWPGRTLLSSELKDDDAHDHLLPKSGRAVIAVGCRL